jgi:hypothetical protein
MYIIVGHYSAVYRRKYMRLYPDKYQQSDFVFFLHIPKTAGTSLSNTLKAAFAKERIITPAQMNNVRAHPKEIFLNAELLCGHFTHEVYAKRLPKQPDFILTFLRNPIEHYASTFFHLKIDPTFAYTTRLVNDKAYAEDIHRDVREKSIEEFLQCNYSAIFDNFQTRYLVKGLSSGYHEYTDEELLPIAQRLLLDLPFFGLTNRFEESLKLLESAMLLDKKLHLLQSNKSRNKPRNFSLSPDVLTEIESRARSDMALFDLAQQAFEARFGAYEASTGGVE